MVPDLSRHHSPVADIFPRLDDRSDLASYALSEEQLAFYEANGFVGGIPALDQRQIDTLRAEISTLMDPSHPGHGLFYEFHSNEAEDPNNVLFHALGHWRITPGFHDLLWHPALLVPAAQLLGGAVRFWHDQLFCKPARHGGVVPWHQDYSYWTRTEPHAHLTCWVALDDATVDNGCVYYVPGSHRWRLLPIPEGRHKAPTEAIRSVLTPEEDRQFQPVPVEVRRGECIFHSGMVLHGSYENRTDRPRRAAVVNYFLDGTLSASDDPLLHGVPVIPKGTRMEGQFFPLLFDPARVA